MTLRRLNLIPALYRYAMEPGTILGTVFLALTALERIVFLVGEARQLKTRVP
jgi:hypothetical protein